MVHSAPIRETASAHEFFGPRPPARDGWPIGRKAGQPPIGISGGLTFVGVRERQLPRKTSLLTPIVEIIDAKY
jgi:hypothetical protein